MLQDFVQPTFLKRGDKVAITGLASKIDNDVYIKPALELLHQWGVEVVTGQSLHEEWFAFAGTDSIRQNDFQTFLDDSSIKAIFSARGGYGSSRYLDKVDFTRFKNDPKWIIGFSDITAVLSHALTLGIQSIHGPMPKTFFQDETGSSLESLRKVLFGELTSYQFEPHTLNRVGNADGILFGGNLCLLAHLIGSKSDVDTAGKILFLEDVDEYHYSVDRLMVQLKRAGKLDQLKGLLIGSFSDMKDNAEDFGMTPYEIIRHWTQEYDYPIAFGVGIGHEAKNLAMPVGRPVQFGVNENSVELKF
ncbi:LD-carboxypeptidase [Siphonobacter sp. SORGH_AS_0500]|uniref:S66 peptidase family protein n=1 Tax=Siphonobacter sp. SORGH_AS_0500 TaxID=1864824 RepID=UPI002859F3B6|nr:LD-carboxypeptidase [Siphonobacter sp. SORGH_AS_0500]MDR6193074.1 muramoyltetrapeptide carboxypeptidase [Siphonobacter sp. SORGH_AS_0500]